jgi:putative colanic acid biosynthesis glycosyltransferase
MILFSIITICRNNLDELKATFESVHSQSLHEYEWIVVDGDSKDGTKEWLKTIPFDFSWISEKDSGIFDAMNKGITLSKGKFLIFMNSGDIFADKQVLCQIQEVLTNKENEPILMYGDSIDIDETGKSYYRKAKNYDSIQLGMITQHQAMLFNRLKIKNINFLIQFNLTADYALVCDIIKKCNPEDIAKFDFAVCKFSMGGTNESFRFRALKQDFKIRRTILKMTFIGASLLYLLHFFHTIFKKIIPSLRFLKHDLIT